MATYKNGRYPNSALRGLATAKGKRLTPRAAKIFDALSRLHKMERGTFISVTDAYRSYEEQVRVKRLKGIFAATPGTSLHGLGHALDLGSGINVWGSSGRRWFEKWAPRFGWHSPAWAQPGQKTPEPWHWEFKLPATMKIELVRDSNLRLEPHGRITRVMKRGSRFKVLKGLTYVKGGYTWYLSVNGRWVASTQFKRV